MRRDRDRSRRLRARHQASGIHGGARFACERRVGERFEKFNLLGETEHRPREAACPRAEGRVALLAVGAAIGSVGGIEQRFMRHAPAHIVGIAAGAEIDTELRGGPRVLQQSIQQTDLDVLLLAQSVTELVRQRERAQRPKSVDKQRVRAVERVDIAAALRQARPAAGLHRAADFERQLACRSSPQCGSFGGHASGPSSAQRFAFPQTTGCRPDWTTAGRSVGLLIAPSAPGRAAPRSSR